MAYNFDPKASTSDIFRDITPAKSEFFVSGDSKDSIAKNNIAKKIAAGDDLSYWDYETGQKVEDQWAILHEDNTLNLDPEKFTTQVKSLTSKIDRFLQELKSGKAPEQAGGEVFTSAPPL